MSPEKGDPAGRLGWQETGRELLERCAVFDLYRSRRRSAAGREGDFYLLEAPQWVNVVPVLGDRFLMVRQYRHGLDRVTVEFPAGLVEPGEALEEAARRELLEETGYRAESLREIGRIAPNPAFMNNWCTTWLAEGLVPAAGQELDELEELEVLEVPVEELIAGVGRDGYVNAMVLASLYWYLSWRGRLK